MLSPEFASAFILWKYFLHWVKKITHTHTHLTIPSHKDTPQSQFLKWSSTGLNSKFSFFKISCHTNIKKPSLPNYLPIAGGRILGSMPFPRVLVLRGMQIVLSKIWPQVAVSISYDIHCTTSASKQNLLKPYNYTIYVYSCTALVDLVIWSSWHRG